MEVPAFLETVIHWISTNPGWSGWFVFLIALGESLAVVGLFVPGAVLMFAVGALIGGGVMDLWPTLAWAAAGAVVGDGVSYWLGRHYHQNLRGIWPFSRYPSLIDKGEAFFRRHGGKGVLLGRFVGPVRPVIPLVAGMMDMPAWRFTLVNVLSALLWAPVYILPGVVFSSSLSMATEVAGRLAVLILLLFGVVLVTVWLVRRVFWWLQPHVNPVIGRILEWSRHHPVVGEVAEALLDPDHPEARGLAILSAALFFAVTLSVLLIAAIQESRLLGNLDLLIFNALQSLRTPWADRLMVFVTWFGEREVVALLVAVTAAWLGWRRAWRAVFHLLVAVISTEVMVLVLKTVSAIERPVEVFYTGANLFSFPSEHAALATVTYGMLAIIVAGGLPVSRRWLPYALAGMMAALIGFSRLYLGVQWFSDVMGGIGVGAAWAALVGIAYRRHMMLDGVERRRKGGIPTAVVPLSLVILSGLAGMAIWGGERIQDEMDQYAPTRVQQHVEMEQWWEEAWVRLPIYRADFRSLHDHPMTVQWAGRLDAIEEILVSHGWRKPPPWDFSRALHLLAPREPLEELPVLPQVHDGRHEVLHMVHSTADEARLLVLRLWPTDISLMPGEIPLWQGNVSYLHFSRLVGLLTIGRTESDFSTPLQHLAEEVGQERRIDARLVHRKVERSVPPQWGGEVILIRPAESPAFPEGGEVVPGVVTDR